MKVGAEKRVDDRELGYDDREARNMIVVGWWLVARQDVAISQGTVEWRGRTVPPESSKWHVGGYPPNLVSQIRMISVDAPRTRTTTGSMKYSYSYLPTSGNSTTRWEYC